MNQNPRTVDETSSLAAAIWLGIVGSFVLLILPVFVGTLVAERGFSETMAGWIGSADLIGFAGAAVVAFRLVRVHNWRVIVVFGLLLIMVGDLSSIFLTSFWPLFSVRLLFSGFGAGFVIAIPYTLLGDTQNPARNTGIYFTFNVLGGAAGLFFLPGISDAWGATGLFITLAGTAASALPVTLFFLPTRGAAREYESSESVQTSNTPVYLILSGIALFNFGMGGVWAFVERIGVSTGFAASELAAVLSGTYLVGMAGSSLAAWQSDRFGFVRPYFVGISVLVLSLFLFSFQRDLVWYSAALILMNVSWNYSLTYQFSGVFAMDRSGRMPVLIILVQALGLMLGPGAAGLLVSRYSYDAALVFGALTGCISAALFAIARRQWAIIGR